MFAEFKKFIMRGNVMDMAVGIIIGIAFGAVVTSLVNDIIMPPIGMLMKNINFNDLFVALNGATYATLADAKKASAPVIAYGSFINTLINFLIVSFARNPAWSEPTAIRGLGKESATRLPSRF